MEGDGLISDMRRETILCEIDTPKFYSELRMYFNKGVLSNRLEVIVEFINRGITEQCKEYGENPGELFRFQSIKLPEKCFSLGGEINDQEWEKDWTEIFEYEDIIPKSSTKQAETVSVTKQTPAVKHKSIFF